MKNPFKLRPSELPRTRDLALGKVGDERDRDWRLARAMKMLIYGASPWQAAASAGVPIEEARELLKAPRMPRHANCRPGAEGAWTPVPRRRATAGERAVLLKDGWREGKDGLWRAYTFNGLGDLRFGGSYRVENALKRVGSKRGEVTPIRYVQRYDVWVGSASAGSGLPPGDYTATVAGVDIGRGGKVHTTVMSAYRTHEEQEALRGDVLWRPPFFDVNAADPGVRARARHAEKQYLFSQRYGRTSPGTSTHWLRERYCGGCGALELSPAFETKHARWCYMHRLAGALEAAGVGFYSINLVRSHIDLVLNGPDCGDLADVVRGYAEYDAAYREQRGYECR